MAQTRTFMDDLEKRARAQAGYLVSSARNWPRFNEVSTQMADYIRDYVPGAIDLDTLWEVYCKVTEQ